MSKDIQGLVETSANIGIADTTDGEFFLTVSVRSSKDAEKRFVLDRIVKVARSFSAKENIHGAYPAWEYKSDSSLRDIMCRVYRESYGEDAKVVTIHAGLECGIFTGKIPTLDCLSLGPSNYDIHTTKERLSISSFVRVYDYLKKVMKEI
jgi:dipeptidase D